MRRLSALFLSTMALASAITFATPAAAIDSFFDVFTEIQVSAPPYPSSPVITIVGADFGGGFTPTQSLEQSSEAVILNGLPPGTPWTQWMTAGGGGAGGTPPGLSSFFDVFYDIELPAPSTGRRISDVRIVHPPGTPPGTWRLVPIHPGAPPGSVDSFFDVFVDVGFFDITYRVRDDLGEHTYHTHGVSPRGRMSFFDVFVELGNPAPYPDGTVDSFFDVFVDFQMTPGPPNGLPDFRETTTGTFEGGPTSTAATSWGAVKGLYR